MEYKNVICAIRTVEKLSDTPIPINNNINARPVTISAFNIGIFVILVSIALGTFFILFMARQATTPITVAINADILLIQVLSLMHSLLSHLQKTVYTI